VLSSRERLVADRAGADRVAGGVDGIEDDPFRLGCPAPRSMSGVAVAGVVEGGGFSPVPGAIATPQLAISAQECVARPAPGGAGGQRIGTNRRSGRADEKHRRSPGSTSPIAAHLSTLVAFHPRCSMF
jgi:hypothetical protein